MSIYDLLPPPDQHADQVSKGCLARCAQSSQRAFIAAVTQTIKCVNPWQSEASLVHVTGTRVRIPRDKTMAVEQKATMAGTSVAANNSAFNIPSNRHYKVEI